MTADRKRVNKGVVMAMKDLKALALCIIFVWGLRRDWNIYKTVFIQWFSTLETYKCYLYEGQWSGTTPCVYPLLTWHHHTWENLTGLLCYILVLVFGYLFFWLKWIPVDKLTQNLGLTIPFHLYIHDRDCEQAIGTLACVLSMYVPSTCVNKCLIWKLLTFLELTLSLIYETGNIHYRHMEL